MKEPGEYIADAVPPRISEIAQQIVENVGIPLCVFNENAAVVWLNAPARHLFDQIRLRVDQDGEIRQTHPPHGRTKSLRGRIKAAIRAVNTWPSGATEIDISQALGFTLKLFRTSGCQNALIAGVLEPRASGAPAQAESCLTAYGLTKTEKKIVEQLIQGRTAFEIASLNRIAVHTVRTHIKHIYSKMGVNCREKMYAQLAAQ